MIINTFNELQQTLIEKNLIINNLTKTSEQTKLDELKIQQQNLKQQSIKIHNEIKYLKKLELNNCHSNKSDNYYINSALKRMREELIETFSKKDNKYNLALTLNLNPKNFTGNFVKSSVENKLKEFWKLYCQYNLGRDVSKYKKMKYVAVIEHQQSNIHIHLAIHHINENINDEFIYDEENVISILWKTVINSGTVFLDKLYDKNWFNYIFKSENFYENMLISDF